MEKNFILAFDPGRDKIGFALVNFDGELIFSGIFPSDKKEIFFDMLLNEKNLEEFLIEKLAPPDKGLPVQTGERAVFGDGVSISKIKFIAVGNGTKSKDFYNYVKNKFQIEIKIIDEKNTTLEARKLYWKIHEPDSFQKFLPEGLRVPKRVLDDLAAWAIALRAVRN